MQNGIRRERANDVHFDFWFCSHLQPLVTQASKLQHLHFEFLAVQKFGIYYRKSLGTVHDFSACSSGENRKLFAEQHCRNLGFLLNCVRRNHDILQTEVAVTCNHLATTCKWLQMDNQNAHPLRAQWEFAFPAKKRCLGTEATAAGCWRWFSPKLPNITRARSGPRVTRNSPPGIVSAAVPRRSAKAQAKPRAAPASKTSASVQKRGTRTTLGGLRIK